MPLTSLALFSATRMASLVLCRVLPAVIACVRATSSACCVPASSFLMPSARSLQQHRQLQPLPVQGD